jgi:hypothetical protein
MSSEPPQEPEGPDPAQQGGVADSLRAAVERTMKATAGSAAERAGELVDDVVQRGREARDELGRRGQAAGVGLVRRGQEATGEVGRRLELLERRLAELEHRLGDQETPTDGDRPPGGHSNPKAEG